MALSISSASGYTAFTKRMRNASEAGMGLPVRTNCIAYDAPTTRGRRCVPPKPGVMPSVTSGWATFAPSPARRISQQSASSNPPPSAYPLIAAMVGTRRSSSALNALCATAANRFAPFASKSAISPMSAPAINAFCPVPVTMSTRTESSASISRNACSNSVRVSVLSALSARGRLTVSTAMLPYRSTRIFCIS